MIVFRLDFIVLYLHICKYGTNQKNNGKSIVYSLVTIIYKDPNQTNMICMCLGLLGYD